MLQSSNLNQYNNKSSRGFNKTDYKSHPFTGAFVQFFYFIIAAAALPARLLLRENFGERLISPMSWFVAISINIWYVFKFAFLGTLLSTFFVEKYRPINWDWDNDYHFFSVYLVFIFNPIIWYFIDVLIMRPLNHFEKAVQHAKLKNFGLNSYHRGEAVLYNSYLGKTIKTVVGKFQVDDNILRIIVQPRKAFYSGLIIAISSLILSTISILFWNNFFARSAMIFLFSFASVGLMISFSSICLFLDELSYFLRVRGAALDLLDGEDDLKLILKTKKGLVQQKKAKPTPRTISNSFPNVKIL